MIARPPVLSAAMFALVFYSRRVRLEP